ncbi:MAG: phosphate/phosphite/phosphonate ABC transporter substrate-binding protein [Nitrosomonas sp.]|nr:phosphate/phosphite/phosphonate ABC transporter substrate-binding protein [Nitrosomonas sp.]MDH5731129.1 phosphate/phosphite/phosphonate ABC transporter substrate-binding protein [Gammaproteobacteria bacterium]
MSSTQMFKAQLKQSFCFIILQFMAFVVFAEIEKSFAGEKVYSFAVIPQFHRQRLQEIWLPIIQQLEQASGYSFRFTTARNIPEFEKKYFAGEYDVAYVNPYLAVANNMHQTYIPILKDVARELQGIIVVPISSPIQTVAQLKNQRIAFPAPNALGASLLIRSDLKNSFKINVEPVYVQSHSSVYLNVIVGTVAAGGGVQKTLSQQSQAIRQNLRILYSTRTVASHPIMIHKRLSHVQQQIIKNSLIEISKYPNGKNLFLQIPVNKLGDANIEDYLPLLELGLEDLRETK